MHRTYILLLLGIFFASAVGCATEATAYKASSDEIVNYKPEPQETIVVFPTNFRAAKKTESSDKDVEMYLRYADALDLYRFKHVERREQKRAEYEKRKEEWKKRKAYEEELRKAKEEARKKESSERVHTRWWRYAHNARYVPGYNNGMISVGWRYFYEWWDPCLPNTGHRAYLRAAGSKEVMGPTDQPTTRGTTVPNSSFSK